MDCSWLHCFLKCYPLYVIGRVIAFHRMRTGYDSRMCQARNNFISKYIADTRTILTAKVCQALCRNTKLGTGSREKCRGKIEKIQNRKKQVIRNLHSSMSSKKLCFITRRNVLEHLTDAVTVSINISTSERHSKVQ